MEIPRGFEPELWTLLVIAVLGPSILAPFETETRPWKKLVKWGTVIGIAFVAHHWLGHLAIGVILALATAGIAVHVVWCRRHGIDPLRATPRRRYYELRGWDWPK